ncbi:UdgX family uracil-DNA binding protein [Sulfitobacter sp. JB4-11]|uniref:UdgX family uracil-DNA binding protein n=1 Tax=Sulfitobacter rhodophyticola TaxID=3238304 RepID=UPI0035182C41
MPRLGTFDVWRDAARALAGADVASDAIAWRMEGDTVGLFEGDAHALPPITAPLNVPRAFPTLAKQVITARNGAAPHLLYDLLLRLRDAPKLLNNRADPMVQQASEIAKNIRRDMHKMKAFVRFREVTQAGANRRQFLSWFEPDHRIEELIAPFFTRRFGDMDWVIVTPEVTTRFEGGALSHEAVRSDRLELSDDTEELWRTYYANIFNPARLKIKAMQSEMPKKYWKNLPEAALIPDMIATAEARAQQMQDSAPSLAPARADRILARLPDRTPTDAGPLAGLSACTRCPLGTMATQGVPGEGPQDARLMIVGEQPGDQEDLQGRPFVGPAGQLFDRVADEAGLDRQAAYVTNAVKHFKFLPRGKRRIHQTPTASEVDHCRWWLEREVTHVQPVLMVALGATAARALTGDGRDITRRRGRVEAGLNGLPVLITLHPAAILRAPDPATRAARQAELRADLARAVVMLDAASGVRDVIDTSQTTH